MKRKILTITSTLMIFIPWTILPLRTFDWALKSPTAEIIIASYAVFMIFSGLFTFFSYVSSHVTHKWMQVCLVINSIYAVGGIAALLMMIPNALTI